ncbi:hypothetical protein ACUXST_002096 [Sphingomonas sp. F9_3S_D5_B_2]|jgi:hypothetical protein
MAVESIETRYQIIGFWFLAVIVQLLARHTSRVRLGASALILNGGAATIAMMATKFAIEGFPPVVDKALTAL